MKVAVCISGFMRTFIRTFPSFSQYFLSHYPSTDIFISTWDQPDGNSDLIGKKINIDKVKELYQPKLIEVQTFPFHLIVPEIMEKKADPKRNNQSVLSMFYKIKCCNNLKKIYEEKNNFKYDIVLRFRSDLQLMEDLMIEENDKINIPLLGDYAGVNDQVAFSGSEKMDQYSEVFPNIEKYMKEIDIVNPELIMKKHLEGFEINRFNLSYGILYNANDLIFNK